MDSQTKRADAGTEKAPVAPLSAGTSAVNQPMPTREAPSTSTAVRADAHISKKQFVYIDNCTIYIVYIDTGINSIDTYRPI
jgi:hypothetical protein